VPTDLLEHLLKISLKVTGNVRVSDHKFSLVSYHLSDISACSEGRRFLAC
jgi:hypothetical protein